MSDLNFGIVDKATGRLVSTTEDEPTNLPVGLEFVAFSPPLDFRVEMWDEVTRARVPRPAKVLADVYDDLVATLLARGINLNAAARTTVKQALIDVIGSDRFYTAGKSWPKRDA